MKVPFTFTQILKAMFSLAVIQISLTYLVSRYFIFPFLLLGVLCGIVGFLHSFFNLEIKVKCPKCRSFGTVVFGYQSGFSGARPIFNCTCCGQFINKSLFFIKVRNEKP